MADAQGVKRFWKEVASEPADAGWRVTLDGRAIRTQSGGAQVVPTRPLAEALAEEWRAQGEEINPMGFVLRDLADYALDRVRPDRAATIANLLRYAETDTLCYRADPDEALYHRQRELWEPLLTQLEARYGAKLERVSGVMHRPQSAQAINALRAALEPLDDFALAALATLAPLGASLTVALAALEPEADPAALYAAANAEEDWQAELWGWDLLAEQDRAVRLAAFTAAVEFAHLARS